MRNARTKNNTWLFSIEEWLSRNQIQAYFSRSVLKRIHGSVSMPPQVAQDDMNDVVEKDEWLQQVYKVYDKLSLQHPIYTMIQQQIQEENRALREQLQLMKGNLDKTKEEGDSLQMVVSLLSKELYNFLTVEIKKPRSRPFAIMTWYRPPDSSIDLFKPFEKLIGKLDTENIEYYVLGDLNCNLTAPKFDNSTNILSNIAEVYSLDELITEYTRITDKSSTLIDLIFTNTPDRIVCSGVSHIGISDHSLVSPFVKFL